MDKLIKREFRKTKRQLEHTEKRLLKQDRKLDAERARLKKKVRSA